MPLLFAAAPVRQSARRISYNERTAVSKLLSVAVGHLDPPWLEPALISVVALLDNIEGTPCSQRSVQLPLDFFSERTESGIHNAD